MDDWDNFRFILALERGKTVRGAAQLLGVNHSTVSRKLAWLNQSQGAVLFERTPSGYQISELGRRWLDTAEQIEALTLTADRKNRALASPALSGKVSLSASAPIAQFLLSDALPEFIRRYPKIELCLDATEQNVNLDRSEADIVVRSSNSPPEHLVGRRMFPYWVCYYATHEYFASTQPENFCWIGGAQDEQKPAWVAQSPYPNAPVTVRTTGYQMRFLALTSGMGLSRAACFMADGHPGLRRLPGAKPFEGMDLWVLTHPDLRHSPRIQALMTFLAQTLMDQKALIQGQQYQE